MGKLIFILGGARSGKSKFAIKLANSLSKNVIFIATCQPLDKEMKRRIKQHKKLRPLHWKTFEEPLDVVSVLRKIDKKFDFVIIDCITLLLTNFLLKGYKDNFIIGKIKEILGALKKAAFNSIIVSNEVGLGIVPENAVARDFRDLAGRVNQKITKEANYVYFVTSGIPHKIKGIDKWG